jgi:transaldolase
MEIWLDTADLELIGSAKQMGILHGVTMNPSKGVLEKLLSSQSGPVSVQLTTSSSPKMVDQARSFQAISPRILVEIPVTEEGLKAIHQLAGEKVPTVATGVLDLNQALLAARAGAFYIAPQFSRICEEDMDGIEIVKSMLRLLHRYQFSSKLMASSIGSTEQIKECVEMGAHAVVLNERVFRDFLAR